MNPRTEKSKEFYEGKEFTTTDGKAKFVITKFNAANNIEINFVGTDLTMCKNLYQITKSGIQNPFPGNEILYFNDPKLKYIGCHYKNKAGDIYKVIDYNGSGSVTVQFLDWKGCIKTTTMTNVKNGQVFNPYHINEFGGYLGEGIYSNNKKEYKNVYQRWYNMLQRVNGPQYYESYHGTISKDKCIIDPKWLNYNEFAAWYITNISMLNPNYNYNINKDLLYRFYMNKTNGYKCYGPEFCIVIPDELSTRLEHLTNNIETTNYRYQSIGISDELKSISERLYKDNAITEDTYRIIINS